MRKYSANYSNTNHNFVIQNISSKAVVENKYTPAICIIKNILQRGKPTSLSYFLQGKIHTFNDFNKALPIDPIYNSVEGCSTHKIEGFNSCK